MTADTDSKPASEGTPPSMTRPAALFLFVADRSRVVFPALAGVGSIGFVRSSYPSDFAVLPEAVSDVAHAVYGVAMLALAVALWSRQWVHPRVHLVLSPLAAALWVGRVFAMAQLIATDVSGVDGGWPVVQAVAGHRAVGTLFAYALLGYCHLLWHDARGVTASANLAAEAS